MSDIFHRIASRIAVVTGSPIAFVTALLIIIVWATTGPIFNFSDTWQLVINTGTTVVTFLMVFLIQNTQNRDAQAIHLKLDELLKSAQGARNSLVDIEDMPDEQLEKLRLEFQKLHEHSAKELVRRGEKVTVTSAPELDMLSK